MVSTSTAVAVVVLLSSALLMLGDRVDLPPLHSLQKQWAASSGYDLADLSAPVLYGKPLQALAFVARMPVLGRILCNHLAKDNKILEVRKFVSYRGICPSRLTKDMVAVNVLPGSRRP
jgi:hypothetical protein